MNEGDDTNPETNEEKTQKIRKKKSKDGGMMDSSKKRDPSRPKRRESSEGVPTKTPLHRKSTDTSQDPKYNKDLSLVSKAPRSSARGTDEASAVSTGSRGSRGSLGSKRSVQKGTRSQSKSPRESPINLLPPGGVKKAVDMWDAPAFGSDSASKGTTKSSTSSGFGAAFDKGENEERTPDVSTNIGSSDNFADNAVMFPSSSSFGDAIKSSTIMENEAFSSDAISFFDTKRAKFEQEDATMSNDSEAADAFAKTPVFGSSLRESLDKTPLKNPPRRKIPKLSLVKKQLFARKFACPPVKNPLNGNIIFCASKNGEMHIQEVDPKRGFVQVLSSPILTFELHKKVTSKYNRSACGVDNVLKLCVGVHRSQSQTRLRVVAVIDLLVLDSKHILRAMAVWQWGYGATQPISLQFLLSPPSGTDYFYHPENIAAADNIVFVAGASTKGPCIFMCKPSVREAWSANFLASSGKITSMAVTTAVERNYPYMAVGMSDGSLSVWTYAAALKQSVSKKDEPFRRLLYPLCRLDALWVLNSLQASSFADDKKHKSDDKAEPGQCTSIEWLPPQSSLSSLLMVAVGFQGGFAVFHVALPHIADNKKDGRYKPIPSPTQSTQLSQTPPIRPFLGVRLPHQLPDVFVSWFDFGPHNSPCLAILLHGRTSAPDDEAGRVVLGAINMTEYRKGAKHKESLAAFRVLSSTSWRSKTKALPQGLLSCSNLNAVVSHSEEGISALYPTLLSHADDPNWRTLRYPVFSNPPGIDSTGEVCLTDCKSDREGILHVFSTLQCDLTKNDQHPELVTWSRPTRRHWLCRTVCGDRKATSLKEEAKEASQFGEDEDVAIGGSSSDVICELESKFLSGLTPFRIVRCPHSANAAVLYRSAFGNLSQGAPGLSMDCVAIALIDTSKKNSSDIEIVEGRDIAFLPLDGNVPRALVLGRDACSVLLLRKSSNGWNKGNSCRPILGVECDDTYIEAQRIFVVGINASFGIAIAGKRHSDEKNCVLLGPSVSVEQLTDDEWTKALPEMPLSQPCLWLQQGEDVLSLISLPRASTTPKLAACTLSRVLIFDTTLHLLAASHTSLASGALAPLGASSVCFCTMDFKIRYLSCVSRKLSTGVLATLPTPKFGYGTCLLLALRPDRFLYYELHNGSTLAELEDDPNCFMLPAATTKPALLLEPLVANAICEGAKNGNSTPLLRTVIEKFGRKMAGIMHDEHEGIGNRGTGITPRVYELLSHYNLHQAASWLLTGSVHFDRAANSKILPPWMPVSAKRKAAVNADAYLHLVANGDQYLSEYVQSPDNNMISNLPRPGDSTSYLCRDYGQESLGRGSGEDALKMLDLVGTESQESMLLQLSLLLEIKNGDATQLLKSVSGYGEKGLTSSTGLPRATTSLAALATHMKIKSSEPMNTADAHKWMKPLAPSLQRGTQFRRGRQRLLGEQALSAAAGTKRNADIDPLFMSPCNELRHVWSEGPNKEKENLLLLDKIEDWLGQSRPLLVGKEGVAAAEERGEGALANILDTQDQESEGKEASDVESEKKDWEAGVGEGRTDEDNLSGYFRFWEGEEEEHPWRTEGFSDLSQYHSNRAIIFGQATSLALQSTTSTVDEGEPGRVKVCYDLVFEEAGDQEPTGLAIAASRGSSIDVGMLHLRDRAPRQKCTVEFWYYLPQSSAVTGEVILARRTVGEDANDFSKACVASDKRSMLWELALLKSGELKFRTCGGSEFLSSQNRFKESESEETGRKDLALFERWNHVCIVFSSRGVEKPGGCSVRLFVMGSDVASMETSMLPPGLSAKEYDTKVDGLMEDSHLVFGLNNPVNFRLTEIRIWACARSEDDIKMMMREYLDAAESRKKKFRVKIGKNKKGGGGGLLVGPQKTGGLAPPKGLTPPKPGGLTPPKGSLLGPPKGSAPNRKLSQPNDQNEVVTAADFAGFPSSSSKEATSTFGDLSSSKTGDGFEAAFGSFGSPEPLEHQDMDAFSTPKDFTTQATGDDTAAWSVAADRQDEDKVQKESLWDAAIPLSQQIRSSAAAALIRGPPATRHFGGNRGALPDLRGTDRYGVGGIAICGSEKTIVWRDEEEPPALTYPIGASGAIVSDQLDDEEGSEFLCCFLAKDKRMVVFELNSRTVVVELQMTTKLNFWRFLPPEACESSLCFMLITPVGGFHWMPLDDSPRPRQVWKRGSNLQGKKIVSYEEGGTNGKPGPEMISKVGLICVTDANGEGALEAWLVPICGDSGALLASANTHGAAFCLPEDVEGEAFLPHLVLVTKDSGDYKLTISTVLEPETGSITMGEVILSENLPKDPENLELTAPPLAMGAFPEVLICSLGNIIVVIVRAAGFMIAYELKENALEAVVQENVGHYVIDAVMRFSAIEGGAEIVMLLSENENHKDGRIVTRNFRTSA